MVLMVRTTVIDTSEFARFIFTGVTATVGNIAAVGLARFFVSFGNRIGGGDRGRFCTVVHALKSFCVPLSFLETWGRRGGTFPDCLYAVGCAVYWVVAVVCARIVLARGVTPETAEMAGILIGAGTMTLTSYLGHRFFTYRTYQRTDERLGRAS